MLLIRLMIAGLLLLSLAGCKDLLGKPLGGTGAPAAAIKIDGLWVSEAEQAQLQIAPTKQAEVYQFRLQEPGKLTMGQFVVSYFKRRMVFNIDLASVRVNGLPVVSDSAKAYMMIGAMFDDEELLLAPADMERFQQLFAQYFYAAPIQTDTLCNKENELCTYGFAAGNLLVSKRMKKFNDDFLKKYSVIFPRQKRVAFSLVGA